ncbi:MAG: BatD family protein [Gammaproteobacteria bacterium]|nr:BatD family protein [Gammaproteobacteria bacterium]
MTTIRFVSCLVLFLAALAAGAGMRATVNDTDIDEMETLQLVIRIDGANVAKPDLAPLDVDFDVIASNSSSQFTSMNGRVEQSRIWTLRIRPKRTGQLTIPAIQAGREKTRPVNIRVRPLAGSVRRALDQAVFFETIATPEAVYVQAELRIVRRLFYSDRAQLYSEMPKPPAIEGAVVLIIGDTEAYMTTRDGIRYGVLEQTFAIFPERSGELVIPGAQVTASVRVARRRVAHRVTSESLVVRVKPIPASYPGNKPWFPATRVTVEEDWQPSSTTIEIGNTIKRTIHVRAHGNVGSGIPPFDVTLPADFKAYPDPAEHSDHQRAGKVIGTRDESLTLIPTEPGSKLLPGVEIVWWDVVNDSLRVSLLDPVRLDITGVLTPPRADRVAEAVTPRPAKLLTRVPSETAGSPFWWIGAAVSGWIVAVLVWLRSRRAAQADVEVAARPAKPKISELRARCRGRNTGEIKGVLIEWLAGYWRVSRSSALQRLAQDMHGRSLLDRLNHALYGENGADRGADQNVGVDEIVATIETLIAVPETPADTALPPLYR